MGKFYFPFAAWPFAALKPILIIDTPYETYKDNAFVTPPVTQISWTKCLLIMSGSKTEEKRHFYMALCAKKHDSKRELERQMDSAYYERYMLSSQKPLPESVSATVRERILCTYALEFLDLPEQVSERNLRKVTIDNLPRFIAHPTARHKMILRRADLV